MNDEEERIPLVEYPDGPLPNRLTRSTLMGCLGLAGVLALPLMLFLPFETWGLSRWAFLLIQLLAFSACGGGIWLISRVPSTSRARSNDPMHPLTARGTAPVLERPARWQNHGGMAALVALLALGMGGYWLAAFGAHQQVAIPLGMALVTIAGIALIIFGFCIALGSLEPPALRWVRTPATSGWLPQGGSLMLVGLTLSAWALLIATEARLAWGAVGLVVLLLAAVLVAPAARRLPMRGRRLER